MKYTPEQIEEMLDKVNSFLDDYKKADDEFQTNQRRGHWNEKFGDRLGKYSDKLKILNGDDFDILESSRKEYEDSYSDLTDDEYCDALENNIKATLQRIWPEATEEQVEEAAAEITETATAETKEEEPAKEEVHIEAEDKDGDGEIQKDEVETHTVKEEKPETEEEEEIVDDATDEFYKELEETKKNMPKRG